MEKYVSPGLPNRAFFIDKLKEYIGELALRHKSANITYIFSLKGILQFIETGKIAEYPSSAYSPFELSDRIYLVRQLLQTCRSKNCRMLKDNIGNIENELFLSVSHKNGYLMFPSQSGNDLIYLDITEPGLLFTFLDFCENLDEDMFFTSKETIRLLQLILEKYRK